MKEITPQKAIKNPTAEGGIDKLINRLAYGQQRHGSRTFAGTNISYVS
jgi:hypothetical protein